MISTPHIEIRDEVPYVALSTRVSMQELGAVAPAMIPRLYGWLQEKQVEPAGALFFRYVRMDGGTQLDLEIGVPVSAHVDGDDDVRPGTFPAGRYAVGRYRGPYDGLRQAWPAFEAWREQEGHAEQGQVLQDGVLRGTRAEHYLVGPNDHPDPQQWETELVLYLGV